MQLLTLPTSQILGHILRHNLFDSQGRKLLPKGRRLSSKDLSVIHELGLEQLSVAILEAGDIDEDLAANRLAELVTGAGLRHTGPVHSRVNLLAEYDGVVRVNIAALEAINRIEGLTIATLRTTQLVRAKKRVATIKIIPFAVPEQALVKAEQISQHMGPIIAVDRLQVHRVGVILVGSAPRLEELLFPAIQARVLELGSELAYSACVEASEQAIAERIRSQHNAGATLIILAGETSIMDRDDLTPRAIRMAGGQIEQYGAPVEPGNLLLMAYLDQVPILGAPGCVRSRATNIVDLLLPRLLANEHISAEDIIRLGHGGLL